MENFEQDKISELPDELLVSILSRVSLREAARTSVLSRRWHKIWTFNPTLNFDGSNILLKISKQEWLDGRRTEWLTMERQNYVNWVNSVLESYQGLTLDEFRVRFDLDEDHANDIDRWVNFALEKKIRRFVMDFRVHAGMGRRWKDNVPRLCNSVKWLRSRIGGFPGCPSLRTLLLRRVNVSGEVIEYFASGCPFLEQLCVEGSDSIFDIKVTSPLLCLKHLEITSCDNVKSIDIPAPNLLSFIYYGPTFNMCYKSVPKLVDLHITGGYSDYIISNNFALLSNHTCQLETLSLYPQCIKDSMAFPDFPTFTNIKNFELTVAGSDDISLPHFAYLIKSFPFMSKFTMKLNFFMQIERRTACTQAITVPKCPHCCLKVVQIFGFSGCVEDAEFAAYLIENAIMLEKIIIDPREPAWIGKPWEYEMMWSIQSARNCAMQLKSRYSLGEKLLLL